MTTATATLRATTRSGVLAAALEQFGRSGYAKTSLRDIANHLGLTKAGLYHHFPNKEALLAELFAPVMREADEILARHTRLSTRSHRTAFLTEYFDFLARNRLLLCHLSCDLAVLSTPEVGGRVVAQVEAAIALLANRSSGLEARTRAKAAIGALQAPITLAEPDADLRKTRAVAVRAALAALTSA